MTRLATTPLPRSRSTRRSILCVVVLLVLAGVASLNSPAAPAAGPGFVWPQFGYDEQHSGVNAVETTITPGNVHLLTRLFRVPLGTATSASAADGAPAYESGVNVNGSPRDIVFVTTKDGWILALDAHTGQTIWGKQNGPNGCLIAAGETKGQPCYTTSSPAIEPDGQYVYSYGLDGYVHKYNVTSGAETRDAHWPEVATLKPTNEKGTSSLAIATDKTGTSYLYMAGSGFLGDQGDYQGHVTAINLATGTQHVFNTDCAATSAGVPNDLHFGFAPNPPSCDKTQSAVWSRPGVIYDKESDLILFSTGNGDFDPTHHNWGDSVLAIHPDGTGTNGNPVDSYTPTDQKVLESTDADLGSSAPAILPTIPCSKYPHLAVQGQKINRTTGAAELRLINLDNLSGSAARGPGHTGGDIGGRFPIPQKGFFLTQPTVWTDPAHPVRPWVFVANDNGIAGLRLYCNAGSSTPTLHTAWKPIGVGGTTPIVANGIVYYFGSGEIQALRATTGAFLWSDSGYNGFHWETPIVANGVLYVPDDTGHLTAYALNRSGVHVVKFSVHRQGTRLTFQWTVSRSSGIDHFDIYRGRNIVNGSSIQPHNGKTYRYMMTWRKKGALPAFRLRVILKDGRQFSA